MRTKLSHTLREISIQNAQNIILFLYPQSVRHTKGNPELDHLISRRVKRNAKENRASRSEAAIAHLLAVIGLQNRGDVANFAAEKGKALSDIASPPSLTQQRRKKKTKSRRTKE